MLGDLIQDLWLETTSISSRKTTVSLGITLYVQVFLRQHSHIAALLPIPDGDVISHYDQTNFRQLWNNYWGDLKLETTSAQDLFIGSFMKWVSMAEQVHTSLRSPCTMPSVGWSGVKLAAIGLWSSENAFSGVMNHDSPFGSWTDFSGCGGFQENASCPNT